ncbi:MAG: GNAT family N-acetyltransferase [Erysipelotrichaceae bacterium]|nr:GNAT family N-acetyltransferase [Erysipelotrichaceae bacterium]
MRKEPLLMTNRLILRPIMAKDLNAMWKWVSDERVTKYLTYATYKKKNDLKNYIANLKKDDKFYTFGIVLKDNNELIGSIGCGYSEVHKAWNFGYNICYEQWGKGITTEAFKRLIEYAHDNLNAHDFCVYHAVENIGSQKVIQKCGFKYVGEISYEKLDKSASFKASFYRLHLE